MRTVNPTESRIMFALLSSLRQQSGDGNFLLTLLLLFSRSPAYLTVLRHTCDNTLNYSLKKQPEKITRPLCHSPATTRGHLAVVKHVEQNTKALLLYTNANANNVSFSEQPLGLVQQNSLRIKP